MISITKIHENIIPLKNKNVNIKLQWIPSHCDIKGNDVADKLANEGRTLPQITWPIELHNIKNFIKKQMLKKWQQDWDIKKQNRDYGLLKPTIGNWHWYRNKNRAIEVKLTRLRLGTSALNQHLHKIKRSDTKLCQQCNTNQEENTEHFLLHCGKFTQQRHKMKNEIRKLGINTLNLNLLIGECNTDPQIKKQIIKELILYIKETKRLDK